MIGSEQGRVCFGDVDRLAELARHGPLAADAVAEAMAKLAHNILVPNPPIARAGHGAKQVLAIVLNQDADILDLAKELQTDVDAVGGDRRRQATQITGGRFRGLRQLAESVMRRRILTVVGTDDRQAFVIRFRHGMELARGHDVFFRLAAHVLKVREHVVEIGETLVVGTLCPLMRGFHESRHLDRPLHAPGLQTGTRCDRVGNPTPHECRTIRPVGQFVR